LANLNGGVIDEARDAELVVALDLIKIKSNI
jgi:hypothetical protein